MAGRGLNIDLTKTPGVLDRIYEWRKDAPGRQSFTVTPEADRQWQRKGAKHMPQQQFTIEIRVDYSDAGKFETMKEACRKAGAHLYATAELISDKVKPQIAIYSDDHFEGHKDIDLFDTTIADDMAELEEAGDTDAGGVSQELLDAVRGK